MFVISAGRGEMLGSDAVFSEDKLGHACKTIFTSQCMIGRP